MKTSDAISIHAMFVGQPQTIEDENGSWRSSIFRDRVEGPVEVTRQGLAGDQVTDTDNHGQTGYQEICCHPLGHYDFWNRKLDLRLRPGNVGENWTLDNADEAAICLEDVYRVGTATVQVSVPRVPCEKQARRVGRADWVKQTLAELRTGFYLRVLSPGWVQDGDVWQLQERPWPWANITAFNRCAYHTADDAFARRYLAQERVHPFWRARLQARLDEQAV